MNKYQKQLHRDIKKIRKVQKKTNDNLYRKYHNGKVYFTLQHLWNEIDYIETNKNYRKIKQAIKKRSGDMSMESYYCPICMGFASYFKFVGNCSDEVECKCGWSGSFNYDVIVI